DRELWAAFAKAGLLGAALPESVGGSDGGCIEACLLLEQQGRRVAMIPLLWTIVAAAMPVARFGSKEQAQRLLPGVVTGDTLLTAGLGGSGRDQREPVTEAEAEGQSWRAAGPKMSRASGDRAAPVGA